MPGMHTSLHMSQSAVVRSVTDSPGFRVAGGVISTKKNAVPS